MPLTLDGFHVSMPPFVCEPANRLVDGLSRKDNRDKRSSWPTRWWLQGHKQPPAGRMGFHDSQFAETLLKRPIQRSLAVAVAAVTVPHGRQCNFKSAPSDPSVAPWGSLHHAWPLESTPPWGACGCLSGWEFLWFNGKASFNNRFMF